MRGVGPRPQIASLGNTDAIRRMVWTPHPPRIPLDMSDVLKKELVHGEDYLTREQARASNFEYIETWYDRVRQFRAFARMKMKVLSTARRLATV